MFSFTILYTVRNFYEFPFEEWVKSWKLGVSIFILLVLVMKILVMTVVWSKWISLKYIHLVFVVVVILYQFFLLNFLDFWYHFQYSFRILFSKFIFIIFSNIVFLIIILVLSFYYLAFKFICNNYSICLLTQRANLKKEHFYKLLRSWFIYGFFSIKSENLWKRRWFLIYISGIMVVVI